VPFESRVRELSLQLEHCPDDDKALRLAQELQAILHERIEQLRDKIDGFPLLTHAEKHKPT
jgi:hypothetical protein